MTARSSHDLAGRWTGGMIEYVRTFRAEQFERHVWPAIQAAFRNEDFDDLELAVRDASNSVSAHAAAFLDEFVDNLRHWRAQCRHQGRYPGDDPFCDSPNPECVERSAAGHIMCGMKDCFCRLTQATLDLCAPSVTIAELLDAPELDPSTLCDIFVWAVEDDDRAEALFGSRLREFAPSINRASVSVYLTHFAAEAQVAHATTAASGCRSRLHADLQCSEEQLDALEAFWHRATHAQVGLVLCYAEP